MNKQLTYTTCRNTGKTTVTNDNNRQITLEELIEIFELEEETKDKEWYEE